MMLTEEQREKNRQKTREWYQKPGNADRQKAYKAAQRQRDPERWYAQRRAAAARYNEKHREENRQKAREKREELRLLVIDAYGGRCNCPGCHVHHQELLTVDHVNGGASHRQNRRSTRDIYREIQKLGFPPQFQLLCGSCNLAKSDGVACPLEGQEH
jgi:hypothetical protein